MRLALLTASARFALPISRLFIFEGFGSFKIHSGTVDPDCKRTLAILIRHSEWFSAHHAGAGPYVHHLRL